MLRSLRSYKIKYMVMPSLLLFSLTIGYLFIYSPQASALTQAQALDVCKRKVNVAACERRVRACNDRPQAQRETCRRNAVRVGEGRATEAIGRVGDAAAAGGQNVSLEARRVTGGTCGAGDNAVKTSINLGCTGQGNPIVDMAYAFIKFLTYGIGLVIAGSIIYAGIMYTSSTGNPEQTSAAKKRILNAFIALIFYLLIFAFVQYLVPGGLFN